MLAVIAAVAGCRRKTDAAVRPSPKTLSRWVSGANCYQSVYLLDIRPIKDSTGQIR